MQSSFPRPLRKPVTVSELLAQVDVRPIMVIGDRDTVITAVAALDDAVPGCLAFWSGTRPRAVEQIMASGASVVVVAVEPPEYANRCFIRVDAPMAWFVSALRMLFPTEDSKGIHPTAYVGGDVELGEGVEIGAFAVIGDGVSVGAQTRIGGGVTIFDKTVIGARCVIQANSTVGGAGLATVRDATNHYENFPHLGRVRIQDDVEIGLNCCVVRGILKDTIIGCGTRVANLVNVGHNCVIEEDCWISGNVVLCGSITLERDVMVGAGALINNHVRVGAGARIGMGSVVTKNVPEGSSVFGVPAEPLPTMRPF